MYIPQENTVTDIDKHIELIKQYPLGTLITSVNGELVANHIPFVVKEYPNEKGKFYLIAHLAIRNEQIKDLEVADSCLVVFTGLDSYISPNWYPSKKETHKVVPTWDFAAVHVKGKPTIYREEDFKTEALDGLTTQQEQKRDVDDEEKWKLSETPENYLKIKMKGIVGLKIEVVSTQGKWKHQQKLPESEVKGVIAGLCAENGEKGTKMAEITHKCNFA